jgi:signal transduction histidine kinase
LNRQPLLVGHPQPSSQFAPEMEWSPGSTKQRLQLPWRQRSSIRGRQRTRPLAEDEEADILTPLKRIGNPYKALAIYGVDLLICGLLVYYSGPMLPPFFGGSSPFYRYGFSIVFAAAFAYHYRGGLTAALIYDVFILLGAYFPPPGTAHVVPQIQDLAGSLYDAPMVGLLAAYMATLLENYTRSKRREQDNVRRQQALLRVGETLVASVSDRDQFLQRSAEQMRKGGHFERLVVALVNKTDDEEDGTNFQIKIDTSIYSGLVEAISPNGSREAIEQVVQSRKKLMTFEPLREGRDDEQYGIARLYLPFFKDEQLYLMLGGEGRRHAPFDQKHEAFLNTVGPQLVVALENMRLTEQTSELAAAAERGRIAREIHDGIAQLIYILSLHTETCAALAHRIADTPSEEETEDLAPLAERLDRMVTLSKQALWETRHSMFTLKPLMSGTTTLTQMLTNQLHEFEAISGLPVCLRVEGVEEAVNGDQRRRRKVAQIGTALFRITQEALTNAYKHAAATQIQVDLRYLPHGVEVEIRDNGRGLQPAFSPSDPTSDGVQQRIYSGHGIRGMHERAEELGGTFEVTSIPAGGLCIRACIPT